jgi:hypothetical protein
MNEVMEDKVSPTNCKLTSIVKIQYHPSGLKCKLLALGRMGLE